MYIDFTDPLLRSRLIGLLEELEPMEPPDSTNGTDGKEPAVITTEQAFKVLNMLRQRAEELEEPDDPDDPDDEQLPAAKPLLQPTVEVEELIEVLGREWSSDEFYETYDIRELLGAFGAGCLLLDVDARKEFPIERLIVHSLSAAHGILEHLERALGQRHFRMLRKRMSRIGVWMMSQADYDLRSGQFNTGSLPELLDSCNKVAFFCWSMEKILPGFDDHGLRMLTYNVAELIRQRTDS